MSNHQNDNNCNCNSCQRKRLLCEIRSLSFAINDLALYLDTHPQDTKAIRLHSEYSQRQSILAEKYQEQYGPLTINYSSDTWNWIDEPWPWERGAH